MDTSFTSDRDSSIPADTDARADADSPRTDRGGSFAPNDIGAFLFRFGASILALGMRHQDDEIDVNENERKNAATEACVRIGDLANMFGLTTRAIRFYEECGLITPVDRNGGSHRKYGPRSVIYLKRIQQLKEYGLSLSEIRELFELARSDRSGKLVRARLIEAYRERIDDARRRREELDRYVEDLSWHVEQLERVDDFFDCPGSSCRTCAWRDRCDMATGGSP